MSAGTGGDRFRELEQAYGEYTVYDQHYEKVGKVDDLFVDENDQPEYIGVKTGFLGTKSTLIPIELVRVNDRRKLLEVAADEETIKHAPTFEDDGDITPEYENRVHGYFGLERPGPDAGQQRLRRLLRLTGGGRRPGRGPAPLGRHRVRRAHGDLHGASSTRGPRRLHGAGPHGGATATRLDVPLGETAPRSQPPREEPAASTADPFDADAATRTGRGHARRVEVQGDRNVRVYKRAARPSVAGVRRPWSLGRRTRV